MSKSLLQNMGLWAQESIWEENHKDPTDIFPIYKATGTGWALEDREMSKKLSFPWKNHSILKEKSQKNSS